MPDRLTFTPEWMELEDGSPEERAAFGAIEIRVDGKCLTEGLNEITTAVERAPFVSGFHLAQWLAWNWWRLRWEPRPDFPDIDWEMAHKITSVGEGYDWPHITIWSDGKQTHLSCRLNSNNPDASYRYIVHHDASIPSEGFEEGSREFIGSVCERMSRQDVPESNLHILWNELREEWGDPELSRHRKLEALLGMESQEADPDTIKFLIAEGSKLGEEAIEELAVARIVAGRPEIAQKLEELAQSQGFEVSPSDGLRLSQSIDPESGSNVEAWEVGESLAQAARRDASLGNSPISDGELCDLAAVESEVLQKNSGGRTKLHRAMGFILGGDTPKIVLRPGNKNGRRFQLARLLGDQLADQAKERLRPSTDTHTYRQKVQRAFAAELLSPFEEVEQMLGNSYSNKEKQERVAEHFQVSPWTIENQLANKGLINKEDLAAARIQD